MAFFKKKAEKIKKGSIKVTKNGDIHYATKDDIKSFLDTGWTKVGK